MRYNKTRHLIQQTMAEVIAPNPNSELAKLIPVPTYPIYQMTEGEAKCYRDGVEVWVIPSPFPSHEGVEAQFCGTKSEVHKFILESDDWYSFPGWTDILVESYITNFHEPLKYRFYANLSDALAYYRYCNLGLTVVKCDNDPISDDFFLRNLARSRFTYLEIHRLSLAPNADAKGTKIGNVIQAWRSSIHQELVNASKRLEITDSKRGLLIRRANYVFPTPDLNTVETFTATIVKRKTPEDDIVIPATQTLVNNVHLPASNPNAWFNCPHCEKKIKVGCNMLFTK